MMKNYQKFAFAPIHDGILDPSPIKRKKIITDADLEEARQQGFQEGENSAIAQAQTKTAENMRAIAGLMQMLIGKLQNEVNELNEDAVELSIATAKAIANVAIDEFEPKILNQFIKDAVSNLRNVPRILVKVNSEVRDLVTPHLLQTAKDAGFDGQIEIRGEENISHADCSIEWQNGAISHNRTQILKNIDDAAKDFLASKKSLGVQLDFFES